MNNLNKNKLSLYKNTQQKKDNSFLFGGDIADLIPKTKKIVTAIYMITNLVPESEPLRNRIRSSSLDLLECLFNKDSLLRENFIVLVNTESLLKEILSYIDILQVTGLVSEMNHAVLVKEISSLEKDIFVIKETLLQHNEQPLTELFSINEPVKEKIILGSEVKEDSILKQKDIFVKKDTQNIPKSFSTKTILPQEKKLKEVTLSLKEKRHTNILNILKQKKDASINDVCSLFKDCSSKTIQRDLKELIKEKRVVKQGDRRWAIYNLKK